MQVHERGGEVRRGGEKGTGRSGQEGVREEGTGSHILLRGEEGGAEWRVLTDHEWLWGSMTLGSWCGRWAAAMGKCQGRGSFPRGSSVRTQPRML